MEQQSADVVFLSGIVGSGIKPIDTHPFLVVYLINDLSRNPQVQIKGQVQA
jgi:hypothetical protein